MGSGAPAAGSDRNGEYRADIDGLRGVAVLAVVLFHYGVPGVGGGFVGVDVFFVISGYLITAKLVEAWPERPGARERAAWLAGFYRRRILRIAPAMLVTIAAVLAAGWLILAPGDYAQLGRSAAWSAAGLGNLFFFWNTGYFDAAADTMPLLHLWSLGVEEQFYLAWPLLVAAVLALAARRRALAGWVIAGLVAAGFAASSGWSRTIPRPPSSCPSPGPGSWGWASRPRTMRRRRRRWTGRSASSRQRGTISR